MDTISGTGSVATRPAPSGWTGPGRSRPTAAGRVGPVQVVAVEVALMVVASTAYALPSHLPVGAGLAAALAAPFVLRYRRRWWYEAGAAWLRLRRRRIAVARARPDPLAALAPRLVIRTVTDRGRPLGVGADELGWFAAIAVAPRDDGGTRELRLDSLVRQAGPYATVQVVVRHVPPSPAIDPRSACAQSYRALRDALGVAPPVEVWIAVRLAPRAIAYTLSIPDGKGEREPRLSGHDDRLGTYRALGSALARIGATLTSHGLAYRVLDGAGLERALLTLLVADDNLRRARESWGQWRTAHTVHVSHAALHWPARTLPDLLTDLGRVPAATEVCTSVIVGEMDVPDARSRPIGARVVVRVVAPPGRIGPCLRQLRLIARRLGVGLVRLDGEQALGVYATIPTASCHGWGRSW